MSSREPFDRQRSGPMAGTWIHRIVCDFFHVEDESAFFSRESTASLVGSLPRLQIITDDALLLLRLPVEPRVFGRAEGGGWRWVR